MGRGVVHQVPGPPVEPVRSAVQVVAAVVGADLDRDAVDREPSGSDPVGVTADRGAEVVARRQVVGGRRPAEHDVAADAVATGDLEGLHGRPEVEQGEDRAGRAAEDDPADEPVSLYAATKRSCELMSTAYARLHGLPQSGLRFFTVYGPWGRPDMAYYSFTKSIIEGRPIRIFNHGEMWRDFTYIDDIVQGTLRALRRPATGAPPHAVYNLGNCKPQKLLDFVGVLEGHLGLKASLKMEPMQAGDVTHTFADIEASRRDLGFEPVTPVETGLKSFVGWYRSYHAH